MNHTFIPILIFLKYLFSFLKYKQNVHHFQLYVTTLHFNIYFMYITSILQLRYKFLSDPFEQQFQYIHDSFTYSINR